MSLAPINNTPIQNTSNNYSAWPGTSTPIRGVIGGLLATQTIRKSGDIFISSETLIDEDKDGIADYKIVRDHRGATSIFQAQAQGNGEIWVQTTNNRLTSGQFTQTPTSHTVVSNDTLGKIARQYGTTVSELCHINGISDPNRISLGQEIKLPTSANIANIQAPTDTVATTTPQEQSTHPATTGTTSSGQGIITEPEIIQYTIQSGDNPSKIVARYNAQHPGAELTVEDFMNANPELNSTRLRRGDTVNLPTRNKYVLNAQQAQALFGPEEIQGVEEFLNSLANSESNGNYDTVNEYGYLGKYQMGKDALIDIGYMDKNGNFTGKNGINSQQDFLNNPEVQEQAIREYTYKQWQSIRECAITHNGETINGIKLTISGMLAGAHLVGRTELKKYIESNGTYIPTDANRKSIEDYLRDHGGYNVAGLITNPHA